jgi:transcriptional regulator with XRE-family HTH domain
MNLNEIAISHIKEIRKKKNYTQEEIADKLQLERTTYNKIEMGKTILTLDIVGKLCQILEVDISEILNIEQNKIINVSADKIIFSANGTNVNLHFSSSDMDKIKELM